MQAETILLDPQGKMVNFHYVRKQCDIHGNRPPGDMLTLEQLLELGYTQFEVTTRPENFSEETHFRSEQETPPYIVYTERDPKQVYETRLSRAKACRAAAYREESDPLAFKMLRGEATKEEYEAAVAGIKQRYPYPVSLEVPNATGESSLPE